MKKRNSGDILSFKDLQQHFRDIPDDIPAAIILIASNNKVAKQWRKDYPGIKVTTARRYYSTSEYAIPLPKDFKFSLFNNEGNHVSRIKRSLPEDIDVTSEEE